MTTHFPSVAKSKIPIVLTIAGSDSGGGAGIQADIKAISATGGYACSVVTALTAQNTQGVTGVYPIPIDFIEQQIDAVFSDLNVVAVKIGMLANTDIIELVARKLIQYKPDYVVLDPVMVATSGDVLLPQSAIDSLKKQLFPLADLITPNLPEASVLTGLKIEELERETQAYSDSVGDSDGDGVTCGDFLFKVVNTLKTKAVLIKGGHGKSQSCNDILISNVLDNCHVEHFKQPRIDTQNTHGTGCTLSSAIACYLAQGYELSQAVALAKTYITHAITDANQLDVGQGHGPVNHFFNLKTNL